MMRAISKTESNVYVCVCGGRGVVLNNELVKKLVKCVTTNKNLNIIWNIYKIN